MEDVGPGPHVEDVEPVVVRPGDQLDPVALVERLVGQGYRREYQVEHRGEVAVRGSIVDVYPSTADGPVRIDLWGDEVDRLSAFSVSDQRSRADVEVVELFGCRELLPTKEVRARAAALVATQPWGREQWERLAEGQIFDGMESWLPWLADGEHTLFDLLGDGAGHDAGQVVLVEPRRPARPGRRPGRRGGRPGRLAGPDLGVSTEGETDPPPAPGLRRPPVPHHGAGADDHQHGRGAGHAPGGGERVGAGRGRRRASGRPAARCWLAGGYRWWCWPPTAKARPPA